MENAKKYPGQLVFGLDIGTRSIVGTVLYKRDDKFVIVAQTSKEHDTRAMLDGQIHDIGRVAETIKCVKCHLEERLSRKLENVCIAAAGRVLKTVQIHSDYDLGEEKIITEEDIYMLHSIATEDAYKEFLKWNDSAVKFYCVGSSVVRYYLNDFAISNLRNHKSKSIGVDLIATFLPDDVVDGLYKAVGLAGLEVTNLTLEPIAAIQLAIPERFRLLNIALVDVGAGTSDISITKDGTIIAFGMIPTAGDSLTEIIANHCMVDFNTAEMIKRKGSASESVEYEDIMGIKQSISKSQLQTLLKNQIATMANLAAQKIKELNGGKSVGAVFVVGGGGMIPGYTKQLSEELGLPNERVQLRGKEVMQNIIFEDNELNINSLLVTPIGICLNFYEQDNNFIFVNFNDHRVKLYNNKKLTVMDAAMQTDFPSNGFFPKSGKELNFTINGKTRMVRGELGEPATIKVNNELSNLHTPIKENDIIYVRESSAGTEAKITVGKLPEYKSVIKVIINHKNVELPKFVSVNDTLQSEYYEIKESDIIEILDYYTVEQIKQFMDLGMNYDSFCYVNNKKADDKTQVYENFELELIEDQFTDEEDSDTQWKDEEKEAEKKDFIDKTNYDTILKGNQPDVVKFENMENQSIQVTVNGNLLNMSGKDRFVYVDIFNYINFDLSKPQGIIVTKINGRDAGYMEELHNGDVLEVYWRNP